MLKEERVQSVDLGALRVSAQGLGCMGMSEHYGPTNWDASVATIHRAIELGVTLFDTADVYGMGHNEVLVGRATRGHRDEVQLATKFGIDRLRSSEGRRARGEASYARRSCDASLLRLGVDAIDLYYLHRPPEDVEIEETVGAMSDLVAAGKVKHIGLSEMSAEQLRRAHSVHPIAAVQSEYSLWTRDVEIVVPTMAELGIGLVPFSPLGRGFLTGALDVAELSSNDGRRRLPRFQAEAARANLSILEAVRRVAAEVDAEPAQVALAWVCAQTERLGVPIVPIPGTKHVRWLEQNVGALDLKVPSEDLAALDLLAEHVVGERY
jgi:aryl-alcohol dehydrogenase-like predicted oxidoreductase